jgi:hypothetical protein
VLHSGTGPWLILLSVMKKKSYVPLMPERLGTIATSPEFVNFFDFVE